jgi:hypothetical protein
MKIILIPLIILSFTGSSCMDDNKIAGFYRTIIFVQPGPVDQPLDLHERGGYMELNLREDFTFTGKWYFPAMPDLQMESYEVNLSGTYSVSENTVRFSETNSYLDTELFFYRNGKLELEERIRRGPMNIVLQKVEE